MAVTNEIKQARAIVFRDPIHLLVAGSAISLLGSASYTAAEQLQLKQLTESASWMGLLLVCIRISQFLVGPIAGVWADSGEKKKRLIWLDQSMAIVAGATGIIFYLSEQAEFRVAALLISAVLISIFSEAYLPFYASITGKRFVREEITRMQALKSQVSEVARFAGPSLGAILFQFGGFSFAALINGLSFLISARCVQSAFPSDAPATQILPNEYWATRVRTFLNQLREGYSEIKSNRGMLGFFLGAACTNFFITTQMVVLPFLLTNTFQWPATSYGYALSAFAAGSFIGAWVARIIPKKSKFFRFSIWVSLPLPGLMWALLPLAKSLPLFLLICVMANASFSFVGITMLSRIISETKAEFRGRVFSLLSNLSMILTPPAAVFGGLLLDFHAVPTPTIFAISGLGIILVWATLLNVKTVRNWTSLA